jgi:hypothetical protein
MISRCSILAIAIVSLLGSASLSARTESKYPDWSGQWTDLNTDRWDPSKPRNAGQAAPLIAEYQAALKAAQDSRSEGGRGNTPTISCGHTGMPRSMLVYETLEIITNPNITCVFPQRRWLPDADPQGPAAARCALFHCAAEIAGAGAAARGTATSRTQLERAWYALGALTCGPE